MGLWQPFGVGSTASRPKSRGSVFKHEFLGILSTWHGIFCFILLNINYPDRARLSRGPTRTRTPAVIDIEVEWNRQHFQIFTVPGGFNAALPAST